MLRGGFLGVLLGGFFCAVFFIANPDSHLILFFVANNPSLSFSTKGNQSCIGAYRKV
jgi:hypothetical protein